ncbi:hypothetical protein D3C84_213000 [compost metagenome]
MQVVGGALLVEVELAVDMIHVMHHQAHGLARIAGLDGIDQLVVLVVGAVRTAAAFVLGDDQRGLRHQAALEADQRRILRRLGQFQVELAGQADTRPTVATGEAGLLVPDHLPQFGQLLGRGMLDRQLGNRALDHAPRIENLPGLFHAGAGDHRTTIGS